MSGTEFSRTAAGVATNIQKLVQNVSNMQRMLVHVDTQGEGLRQQLRQLQHYTGQLARDTATQLKQLADTQPPGDSGAKLQRERLQDEFTRVLDNFQRVQREAADREREGLAAAKQDSEIEKLPGPGEGQGVGQSRTQMMLEEEEKINQLQERERSMRQLESDITDVNTIFKDLATMVHEQGDIVDSIESNIESTSVQVTTGTEQLRQASVYQSKARRKKIILALIGLVILAILIAIIATQLSN